MTAADGRERREGRGRSALDDAASQRANESDEQPISLASEEEERSLSARASASGHSQGGHANRQAVMYCPYCAEETLFPLERGWECRSCRRAFSVAFLGLVSTDRLPQEQP